MSEINRPSRAIPEMQWHRFKLAVCERFGLNPEEVGPINASSDGIVNVELHLSRDELEQMFNDAGIPD